MSELIYYVDANDTPTGETCEKYAAHHANTKLHAAFSVYIFNDRGQLLVTQRAQIKKVWPTVWTNSCCGHPFPDESREDALVRRVEYELGMKVTDIQLLLPRYIYKTPPYKGIVEHEFCPVYFARAVGEPVPNQDEVAQTYWMDWNDFIAVAESDDEDDKGYRDWMNSIPTGEPRSLGIWSWWCKDQLIQLKNHPLVKQYSKNVD